MRIMADNTSSVSVLNHMGTSHSVSCNSLCKYIWEWRINRGIWLSVIPILGKQNIYADMESRRRSHTSAEWMLNKHILLSSFEKLSFRPNIDLFASRLNRQIECFVSLRPDPDSYAIDAFTLDLGKYNFYAFPPLSHHHCF